MTRYDPSCAGQRDTVSISDAIGYMRFRGRIERFY
jgi:hypothetical protein